MDISSIDIPRWLDKKFIEILLRQSLSNDFLQITKLEIKPANDEVENFGSVMLRCKATAANDVRHQVNLMCISK